MAVRVSAVRDIPVRRHRTRKVDIEDIVVFSGAQINPRRLRRSIPDAIRATCSKYSLTFFGLPMVDNLFLNPRIISMFLRLADRFREAGGVSSSGDRSCTVLRFGSIIAGDVTICAVDSRREVRVGEILMPRRCEMCLTRQA